MTSAYYERIRREVAAYAKYMPINAAIRKVKRNRMGVQDVYVDIAMKGERHG